MSVLAILLPPRDRLGARGAGHEGQAGLRVPAEWNYLFSPDGRSAGQAGGAALALLPRADRIVLVMAESDVSWHRIDIPKAPAARLRSALLGVMEEALLEDDEALHFALAPDAVPGQPGWVAIAHKPWLAAVLAAIESSGLSVERVVAPNAPAATTRGHFFNLGAGTETVPWLSLCRPEGSVCLRLSGGLARALQPAEAAAARWTATPAAAAAAERWLGAPVTLMTESERALEAITASQGAINLRQFDLAARHRGTRALREMGRRFLSSEWRATRLGLAAVAVVHLVGLNVYAWQQRQVIADKRAQMVALLKTAYPGVRAVLDAPLQMQRETERLRAAAGRAGDSDLEALLGAAATAWPDGLGPAPMLRFEAGRLVLGSQGWAEPQMTQFRDRLRGLGFAAEIADGRINVSRAAARGAL